MIGTPLTPSQNTKGSINRSLSVNIPWAPKVFFFYLISVSFGIRRKAVAPREKKQLRSSRELYQAVSTVYFILFREKTSGASELWTQIIELILLTMSTNWLNTFKKIIHRISFLYIYIFLCSFLKIYFYPFFPLTSKPLLRRSYTRKF